jgi:xanthine dehydrogenase molybdenum-binding subunit
VKIGAKQNGEILAIETELYGDTGAYASLGDKVMTRATTHSAGPYDVPNVRGDCYAMYTNNPPSGAFRGFGVTQSVFAIESMIDMLAEKLSIDPVELRRLNVLKVGSITNTGQKLDESVGLMDCLKKVNDEIRKINPDPFKPIQNPKNPHLVRAWGLAAAYKNTGLGGGAPDISSAEIELFEDGTFEIRSSAAELGQGLVTVMQMIVSEELGVPLDKINVLVMDTDLSPDGGPTTASRQTYITGNASRYASIALREAISGFLAEKYDCQPNQINFKDGFISVCDEKVAFNNVAREMKQIGLQTKALYSYEAPQTQPLGTGGDMHFAYSYAVQAAEVEVNKITGEVRVLQVISANDVGTALNPLGLQAQVEGGVMMGIGHCLTEEFIVEEGHVITDQLARYRIPGIQLTPKIQSIIVEEPTAEGPYGAKGVGEISSIPTTPAITNAIYNAVGVRIDRTPVDQEVISKALWQTA